MAKSKYPGLYRPKFKDETGQTKISKTWWMSFSCRGCSKHIHSGRHRESTDTESITEAKRIRDSKLGSAAEGKPLLNVNEITLREILQDVEDDYTVKGKRSLCEVQDRIKNHIFDDNSPVVGRRAIELCLNENLIKSYVAWRKNQKAANSSINYELSLIRRGFSLNKNRIPMRPNIEMLPVNNARKKFFTEKEYLTLIKHLPDDVRRPIQVAWLTGWRTPSEILTRMKDHADLKGGRLILEANETKNGESRYFPLTGKHPVIVELKAILEEQLQASAAFEKKHLCRIALLFHHDGKPMVLPTRRGTVKTTHYFRNAWDKACKAAGLADRIPHDFRRSSARRYRLLGFSNRVAMKLSGWKTESMFHRYDVISDEEVMNAFENLPSVKVGQSLVKVNG